MMMNKRLMELALVILALAIFASFSFSYTIGLNYRNISVDTKVNVTNAYPEFLALNINPTTTLVAGGTQQIECNASLKDYNGYPDIIGVNGTLYDISSSSASAVDNNNTHYTNLSCYRFAQNGIYSNYTCTFNVYYYANATDWNCSITVNDTVAHSISAENTTTIGSLYALNVSSLIDYGDLAVEDTSKNRTANVTNFGNVPINISVYGYGDVPSDGLAMTCLYENITIENEKFSSSKADNFATKTALAATPLNIAGLTVSKQTVANTYITNTTYWQLYVPPNPFGECNGTVVFQAETAN